MPTLSIKNVPEPLLAKLRERAARNHRSLQGELMVVISDAVETEDEGLRATRGGGRTIEDIVAAQNRRWKEPFTQGPLAVDIIRADRDAR